MIINQLACTCKNTDEKIKKLKKKTPFNFCNVSETENLKTSMALLSSESSEH